VEEQWGVGTEVPMSRVRPGDLVFGDFGPSGPSTVGVYAGNRSMVVAESGGEVTQVPLESGMRARRMQ
jgi:cell wall-associated NlpC family hydrolase